jgi:hypothetical protein
VHPDHDRGLEFDVRTLMARRSALGLISGAGLLALIGCSDGSAGGSGSTSVTTAAGAPLTVNLTVTDSASGYAAMEGVAVYLWHADAEGRYSMYSQGVEQENFLRGVQPTDASGTATFTTVFPGCYEGRRPHIHFEVYRSTAEATSSGQIDKTSQVGLPAAVCEAVYADTSTYRGQPLPHLADAGHGLRRRRWHPPPARDGDR